MDSLNQESLLLPPAVKLMEGQQFLINQCLFLNEICPDHVHLVHAVYTVKAVHVLLCDETWPVLTGPRS